MGAPVVPHRRQPNGRAVRFVVLMVGAVLLGNALVGERGLVAMARANAELALLSRVIDSLRTENDGLREDARQLREDPRAIENLARRELGLIAPGEKLFIVSPGPPQP